MQFESLSRLSRLCLLLFYLLFITSASAQELIMAPSQSDELIQVDLAAGTTVSLYQDFQLKSISVDPATADIYAVDPVSNKLLVIDTDGQIRSFLLPVSDPILVRYASQQQKLFISFEGNIAYIFDPATEVFTELQEPFDSPVYPSGNYYGFMQSGRRLHIVSSLDSSVRDTVRVPFGDLVAASYNEDAGQLAFILDAFDDLTIYMHRLGASDAELVTLSSLGDRFIDTRVGGNSRSFLLTALNSLDASLMDVYRYDISNDSLQLETTVPYGVDVDFIDLAELSMVAASDGIAGWAVDYDNASNSSSSRLLRPLSNPVRLRYDAISQSIYVVNEAEYPRPGGSVFKLRLDGSGIPEQVVAPSDQWSITNSLAFELDGRGGYYYSRADTNVIASVACNGCPEQDIDLLIPSWQRIRGIATAKFQDSIYLLSSSREVYVSDLQGNVRLAGRLDRSDGGDFRVDNLGKFAFLHQDNNENIRVLDLGSGTSSRIIPESSSCITGLSREDNEGQVHVLSFSHSDRNTYYNQVNIAEQSHNSRRRINVRSGPLVLVAPRVSSAHEVAEAPRLRRVKVRYTTSQIYFELSGDASRLVVRDGLGRAVVDLYVSPEDSEIAIDRYSLPAGNYFVVSSDSVGRPMASGRFNVW